MRINDKFIHPRDQIVEVIRRIYQAGLTTTTGGNISIKDDSGDIWVTPTAIDKGALTKDHIVHVRKDGTITGDYKPSSEFPFHKAIYEAREDIRAIIHAHPPALVSLSIVRQTPNMNIIPQAKQICKTIGYAKYELPGSKELGDVIAKEFEKEHDAVILENHGTVVGGVDLVDAFVRFETLEFACRTIINANTIGTPQYLEDSQIKEFESQLKTNIPEADQVSHPTDELSIREEICTLVRRACSQGLMLGSYGTVSVRWQNKDFLITPTDVPRWEITSEDIVQIKDGKHEKDKYPSRAVDIHAEIYASNPHVNAIIITQPPNIMAFGVSNEKLDIRTIPESWVFLQDIPIIPFGSQFGENATLAQTVNKQTPAVIVQNDAILVTGESLMQAFDKLEVAEFSAQSLIMSKPLGEFVPMGEKEIQELKTHFVDGH